MSEPQGNLVNAESRDGILVVTIAAEQLTAVEAIDEFDEEMGRLVQGHPEPCWILDFRSVTFMVTPAVGTIMKVASRLRERQGRLAVTGLSKNIHQIITLMKLDEVMRVYPDVAAALRDLRGRD